MGAKKRLYPVGRRFRLGARRSHRKFLLRHIFLYFPYNYYIVSLSLGQLNGARQIGRILLTLFNNVGIIKVQFDYIGSSWHRDMRLSQQPGSNLSGSITISKTIFCGGKIWFFYLATLL